MGFLRDEESWGRRKIMGEEDDLVEGGEGEERELIRG